MSEMDLTEQIEYFAERHSRNELTGDDIAELTLLCQAPEFAREFVRALGDRADWRRIMHPLNNGEKFIHALSKRMGRRSPTAVFTAVISQAARQRVREVPARRPPQNKGRRDSTLAWVISAAACVALGLVLFLVYGTGAGRDTTAQKNQQSQSAGDLARANEQLQRAERELAEVEAQRARMQQQLAELERRQNELKQSPVPPTANDDRRQALDQIEAERRKVDAELAAMRDTRQKAESKVRTAEQAQAKVKVEQGTGDAKVAHSDLPKPPGPSKQPEPTKAAVTDPDAIAKIETVNGDVLLVKGTKRRKAEPGLSVRQGEGLETSTGANIKLTFLDRTTLIVGSAAVITEMIGNTAEDTSYAKTVVLRNGSMIADVTPQPSAHPMSVRTEQAEIIVVGTRFTVAARKESTWLDMHSGKVNFKNRKSGKAIPVVAGETAVMEADKDAVVAKRAQFMKGVNFGGNAVTIEGERWLSQQDAQADGLSFVPEPKIATTNVLAAWSPEAASVEMLNSAVYAKDSALTIKQTVPQATYDVYFWVMEPQADYHRSFEIEIEGQIIESNVCSKLLRSEWQKLGPYTITVADSSLDIRLIKIRQEPCLMGMAIFRHTE